MSDFIPGSTGNVYQDGEGNECSLFHLVNHSPEWACSRIREGEKAAAKVEKLEAELAELEQQLAALRELLYDAYELGQTDAAGNGTLAGVAYKDKKQVTAALLQESSDE